MNFFKSTFAVVAVSLSFMAAVHADDGGGNFGSEEATPAATGQQACDECTLRYVKGPRATQVVGFNSLNNGALTSVTGSKAIIPAAQGKSAE